ncbi:hypothetical protein [Marvinbryantia formatexigens]|nr:hypothetical protein [Marvinbryantia formatexigens]UWO26551.1 hypothetical protein NQ534_08885 [Marvinbryantia formatexigens DSM 14469]SDF76372.1 hypothetical protein SAMN05660368_01244 [Marvinbryantia formatexigens]
MQSRLQWHPGFFAALQIEFEEESDLLIFENEHPLGTKPRTCFYQSDTERVGHISPDELTLTFVCSHYPHKLLRHLKSSRHISVSCQEPGIYYLSGDPFPMQLLVTAQLSHRENLWLSSLRTNLRAQDNTFKNLAQSYEAHSLSNKYKSAMDLIMRANWTNMKEGKQQMCDAIRELFAEEFEEYEQRMAQMEHSITEKDQLLAEQRAEITRLKKLLGQPVPVPFQ